MDDRLAVRQFLKEVLQRHGDTSDFADSDALITMGRMQSIDALQVMLFLEEEYGLDFGQPGFDQNGLDSIDSIMSLIKAGRRG